MSIITMQNQIFQSEFSKKVTFKKLFWPLLTLLIFVTQLSFSKNVSFLAPQQMEWTINGATRKAILYIPATAHSKLTPIVFIFHGHGGNMENIYNSRGFEKLWPEAIIVCPQGLNTPGSLIDKEGRQTGWEMGTNDDNRDLQFFDAMYASLIKSYKINTKQIFVTGHSNGGGFSYLLLAKRGDLITAIAPSASVAGVKLFKLLKPKPIFHIMGDNDELVKSAWQTVTCERLLNLNQCSSNGEKVSENVTLYSSSNGNPFQWMIYPGGHKYPLEANKLIVDFFKKIN